MPQLDPEVISLQLWGIAFLLGIFYIHHIFLSLSDNSLHEGAQIRMFKLINLSHLVQSADSFSFPFTLRGGFKG